MHLAPRNQVRGQQVCSECKLASFLPAGLEHAPGRGWEHKYPLFFVDTRVASVSTLTALNLLPLDYYRNRPDKSWVEVFVLFARWVLAPRWYSAS